MRSILSFFITKWTHDKRKIDPNLVVGLDKTSGHSCPRCGADNMSIFYEDGVDLQLAAICDQCSLRGYFVNGKLVQLATA